MNKKKKNKADKTNSQIYVGGLVGHAGKDTKIDSSSFNGEIKIESYNNSEIRAGSIVGSLDKKVNIKNSTAKGSIEINIPNKSKSNESLFKKIFWNIIIPLLIAILSAIIIYYLL